MIRQIVLDTNVLMLWLVSRVDLSLLQSFKRVQSFSVSDVARLRDQIEVAEEFVTTPHVLTETSNFLDQAPSHRRQSLITSFENYIREAREVTEKSAVLTEHPAFRILGLSDTSLIALSSMARIVTTDMRLAHFIYEKGGQVAPFLSGR